MLKRLGGPDAPHENRTMPLDTNPFLSDQDAWRYSDSFTIDPAEADRAWRRLNINQMAVDYLNLPRVLHFALIDTIKERDSIAKLTRK